MFCIRSAYSACCHPTAFSFQINENDFCEDIDGAIDITPLSPSNLAGKECRIVVCNDGRKYERLFCGFGTLGTMNSGWCNYEEGCIGGNGNPKENFKTIHGSRVQMENY